MGPVTQTLDNHDTTVPPLRDQREAHRLYRALAWVGIAAGSLFIVATVFFSGYILGQHTGGGFHGGPHGGPHRVMLKPFPGGPGGPDGPMGPDDAPRAERLTPSSQPSSAPARP
jgi:hypothetical protein